VELNGAIVILHSLLFRRSAGVTNPRSDETAEGRAGEDLGESGGHGLIEEKPRLLGESSALYCLFSCVRWSAAASTLASSSSPRRGGTLRHLRHLRHS
jgi:hypothetical protein